MLAPGSVVQKTDQYTSVIREPGKLEVTVRNNNIAEFGTRNERKTKLMDYVNCRGPRVHEKSTEEKTNRHIKEFTRIQKGDRKMKPQKRNTGSGVSSSKSNTARAMRVRMPKVPANFLPPESTSQPDNTPEQQNITSEVIIAPPPTRQHTELLIPPSSAMHQVHLRSTKKTRKSPNFYEYDNDDSSGELTNSCPLNFTQRPKKRRAGDVASVQLSVVETIVDTATRVEPIPNQLPSPVKGEVSPTETRIRPAE